MSKEKEYPNRFKVFNDSGEEIGEIKPNQICELISDVMTVGHPYDKRQIIAECKDHGLIEKDLAIESVTDEQFEDAGYIQVEDITPEIVCDKLLCSKQSIAVWKLQSVMDNFDKFDQSEFENWINNK